MNSFLSPDRSLYQLSQQHDTFSRPLNVRVKTYQALVITLIDFLKEHSIKATLWVKLPATPQWLSDIEAYHQQGLSGDVYLCQVSKEVNHPSGRTPAQESTSHRLIPVLLEASSQLKREYFLIIVSPQFCSLLLASKQPSLSTENSNKHPHLKLVYSFDAKLIETVINAIKQGITITDYTPESLLTDQVADYPLPFFPQGNLMASLLRQQIAQMESFIPPEGEEGDLSIVSGRLSPRVSFNEEFIQGFTRQLSVPLTSLKTALRLLESMQHKREQRSRYISMIQQECDHQTALLSGVQELIQSNQPVAESEISVKLEEVIPGIVSTYQPLAEEKGIFLGYTVAAGLPPVACPRQWLSQILRHLLHNSLKFTPDQGRIQVQANLKNEMVVLTVSDTGVGIESSDLPKIYQSFYQGRNATNEASDGVGLGLTLVKSLVEGCGGAITVSSSPNKGTVFTLTLPVISEQ